MQIKRVKSVCRGMVRLFAAHQLPRAAAGLSYFLTLAFFPMLICLYTMLGSLFPAAEQLRAFLAGILPRSTVSAIADYLRYVSENLSTAMLVAALAVLATASSAAFRIIGGVMEAMRGTKRFTGAFEIVFSFFFSLVFLAAVYFAVLLIVTGKWFLEAVDRHIMFMNISAAWSWARFVLLFLLLFVILSGVYKITEPHGRPSRILPGAAAASLALESVSILFSYFIGFSAKYPLVYGSLASIIIMMFWLYVCGMILFAGGALNVALEQENA